MNALKKHRPIRSFVKREGRFTPGQRHALEILWPEFGLDMSTDQLDIEAVFGRVAPTIIEIGFGNGESLAEIAANHPENNYIGIEVHRPGVGHLLIQIRERQISNLRVMNEDAVEILQQMIPSNSLAAVYLFFPDPWHKKRHHKRRILQESFIQQVADRLQPGGYFHMATDWQDYAECMMANMGASALFQNKAGPGHYSPRPAYRPITKFERRGQRLGHGVWDLVFELRP
ncbi:MAG: tRNA (guanosine(46)-N7)-methyltransferase TrmB [Gammaproteobacteria bacterium]|nr:tRNA (guanosine(46)-N7)-methyltransferase TrmB [Gammaproteobacteria bacterium]